ncbi:MAG: YheC/YheD family protein [Eubacteriales bacterium]
MQQAIPIMKYRGEVFSFRTLAMKNGKGRWVMPGTYSRLCDIPGRFWSMSVF